LRRVIARQTAAAVLVHSDRLLKRFDPQRKVAPRFATHVQFDVFVCLGKSIPLHRYDVATDRQVR
jgi:hypothetical protein